MILDALRGWTATQRNVVIAAYLGWTLDAFDFLMLTLITKDVADEFHVPATALGLVITATLALRPVGAFIFGRLADRFGRRPILMLNVLSYSALAFASAFAPDYMTFLILRCLFGVAMGGEWGVGSSLAMEHMRPESRGIVSGLLQTGYPTGGLIAAGAAALLLQDHGWRFLMMLSAAPALLVLFIRMGVPESPNWKPGQTQAAALRSSALAAGLIGIGLAIVGQLSLFTSALNWLAVPPLVSIAATVAGIAIAALAFGRKHFGLALFAMIMMAGFNALSHGTQDFYSNFLRIQQGFNASTASTIIAFGSLGAIVGGITSGTLSQSIGRRRMITIGALLALPMIPMWAFYSTTPVMFGAAVFALQFCVQGAWGVVPAHLNEISPGELRATFPGFTYQVGNLLSAGVPYGQTFLVEHHHWQYGQALALAAVCAAIAIAVLINLGPEGRHVVMGTEQA
ncbi:MAG: MFS transporter [Proteobacteria bacterium]|nr:MFS transporter [Pseudomonadota bacterium]